MNEHSDAAQRRHCGAQAEDFGISTPFLIHSYVSDEKERQHWFRQLQGIRWINLFGLHDWKRKSSPGILFVESCPLEGSLVGAHPRSQNATLEMLEVLEMRDKRGLETVQETRTSASFAGSRQVHNWQDFLIVFCSNLWKQKTSCHYPEVITHSRLLSGFSIWTSTVSSHSFYFAGFLFFFFLFPWLFLFFFWLIRFWLKYDHWFYSSLY